MCNKQIRFLPDHCIMHASIFSNSRPYWCPSLFISCSAIISVWQEIIPRALPRNRGCGHLHCLLPDCWSPLLFASLLHITLPHLKQLLLLTQTTSTSSNRPFHQVVGAQLLPALPSDSSPPSAVPPSATPDVVSSQPPAGCREMPLLKWAFREE